MRLDKYIAQCCQQSRKDVKKQIRKGQASVNEVICKSDDCQINELVDVICYQGEILSYQKDLYIMLNKPKGVISATEDMSDSTVMDCLREAYRDDLFPIGRLDKDTEGLLLISNDGQLAHALLAPKKHVNKMYHVTLQEPFDQSFIPLIEKGIKINEEETCKAALIEIVSEKELLLTIQEGKYHQIKRMMHACNNEVIGLKRLSMGSLVLDDKLEAGQWRYCSETEIAQLKKTS